MDQDCRGWDCTQAFNEKQDKRLQAKCQVKGWK